MCEDAVTLAITKHEHNTREYIEWVMSYTLNRPHDKKQKDNRAK